MSPPLLFALPGNEATTAALAEALGARRGQAQVHRFPDGEWSVRLTTPVQGRDVWLVCTLDRPDHKLLPLLWLAAAAREHGAARIGLVAPYLPYMRQDTVFREGETVSAALFAQLLGARFDALVTVDPHLHRIHDLAEVFPMATRVVHAAESIAAWVQQHVREPAFVGPDEESSQWVADVAGRVDAPSTVCTKRRLGDRDVQIDLLDTHVLLGRTPVLVDDIVSTGRTMIAAARQLARHGLRAPVCVAVHGLFVGNALAELRAAGAADIVSCDTVAHATNCIPMARPLAEAMQIYFNT
jgi:ribose-phosphate pyrophosphokinase